MQIKQIAMQRTEFVHFAPKINPLADFVILLKPQPKLILAKPHKKNQINFFVSYKFLYRILFSYPGIFLTEQTAY